MESFKSQFVIRLIATLVFLSVVVVVSVVSRMVIKTELIMLLCFGLRCSVRGIK